MAPQTVSGSAASQSEGSGAGGTASSTSSKAPRTLQDMSAQLAESGDQLAAPISAKVQALLRDLKPTQLKLVEDLGQRKPRDWAWYDEDDERQEMRRDMGKLFPTAGYTHVRNIPQSLKKMDRIVKLVSCWGRGCPCAWLGKAECSMHPWWDGAFVHR